MTGMPSSSFSSAPGDTITPFAVVVLAPRDHDDVFPLYSDGGCPPRGYGRKYFFCHVLIVARKITLSKNVGSNLASLILPK